MLVTAPSRSNPIRRVRLLGQGWKNFTLGCHWGDKGTVKEAEADGSGKGLPIERFLDALIPRRPWRLICRFHRVVGAILPIRGNRQAVSKIIRIHHIELSI